MECKHSVTARTKAQKRKLLQITPPLISVAQKHCQGGMQRVIGQLQIPSKGLECVWRRHKCVIQHTGPYSPKDLAAIKNYHHHDHDSWSALQRDSLCAKILLQKHVAL